MFISEAWASAGATADPTMGDYFMSLLPIILIFVVFYVLLLRPQQKRIKEHKEVLNTLSKGDKVVTGGGIIAEIKKVVNDYELLVELSKGIEVRVVRGTIQGKGEMPDSLEPINANKKADTAKKETKAKKTTKKTTANKKTPKKSDAAKVVK